MKLHVHKSRKLFVYALLLHIKNYWQYTPIELSAVIFFINKCMCWLTNGIINNFYNRKQRRISFFSDDAPNLNETTSNEIFPLPSTVSDIVTSNTEIGNSSVSNRPQMHNSSLSDNNNKGNF